MYAVRTRCCDKTQAFSLPCWAAFIRIDDSRPFLFLAGNFRYGSITGGALIYLLAHEQRSHRRDRVTGSE